MASVVFRPYPIYQWKASYYQDSLRKWVYNGTLTVTAEAIVFHDDPSNTVITIHFEDITAVKRRTSMLVFSAVTIATPDEIHWFSSLANPMSVYKTLEHFWRERLIPIKRSHSKEIAQSSEVTSKLGQEMLSLMYDSYDTLGAAADELLHQGEQLDDVYRTVSDINQDLDVAETVISGLESWMGRWKAPGKKSRKFAQDKELDWKATFVEYSILYAKKEKDHYLPGSLTVSKESLDIKDSKMKLLQSYSLREVSSIVASSPWRATIRKNMIGQPDVVYHISSAKMPLILQALDHVIGPKIEYEEPEELVTWEGSRKTAARTPTATVPSTDDLPLSSILEKEQLTMSGPITQSQGQRTAQSEESVVSEAEAKEITNVLSSLKLLAMETQSQIDLQKEKIESLGDEVDRTTGRVNKDTKRMKKLM
ncbi:PREDICTED: synaptosomal-associated protein 47-like [Branchiostoma belcheri]|uniref:Synaptosomal-associated protein 47 n=1 Tax=Branchiostoma belcheri TaxID=7741 RepID=A0A6P4ZP99_BRABE|nr:PREDICTED: synaptosomal-associated protein 47-like [Branchiostoma belcheri]